MRPFRPHTTKRVTLVLALAGAATAAAACSDGSLEELGELEESLIVTQSFQQGAAAYTGATDATIAQTNAAANFGATTTCEADGDDGGGADKSCLLWWALSGIPSDAIVQSVTITLRVVNASANTYNLYELKRAWNEGQVSWNAAATGSAWATPGALNASDRGAVVGSITGATGSRTITLNAAGVALVQGWINGAANRGIVIASATNTDGIDFASSEDATLAHRPKLSIVYNTAGGGGSGGSGSGGSGGSGGSAGGSGSAGSGGSSGGTGTTPTDPNLLIAFMGDQGNNSNADSVLNLIKSEGAAAVVHNGDFDYANDPSAWNARIDAILGPNYPYFAIVGNHDALAWPGSNGYASFVAARAARVPAMGCTGELGVRASCNFRGLHLIESCIGTGELRASCAANSADQVGFIQSTLASSSAIFKICNWHKNQNDMQTGSKGNEVGWQAYQRCMSAGAIVATGHEHSYERTQTLTNIGNAVNHGATGAFSLMQVRPGQSFVFVSGLGGVEIRDFEAAGHSDDTWWATTYASNRWLKNGVLQPATTARYGAAFIRFNVSGDPRRATAYFKDVSGRLVDEYTIQVQ